MMGRRRKDLSEAFEQPKGLQTVTEDEMEAYCARQEAEYQHRMMVANSPRMREMQLTSLAYDAVEERIRLGKASSQEYVYFLKLGSQNAELERRKLEVENKLAEAKIASLQSMATQEELMQKAIEVFGQYKSSVDAVDDVEDEGDEAYDFEN